jgi:hypothetical protein
VIVRRQRAQRVEQPEGGHQQDQQQAPRQLGARDGDQWRAHHHAQRIDADDMAGGRRIHAQPLRHVRHQAHRREFGGADREAAHRQREMDETDIMGAGYGGVHR